MIVPVCMLRPPKERNQWTGGFPRIQHMVWKSTVIVNHGPLPERHPILETQSPHQAHAAGQDPLLLILTPCFWPPAMCRRKRFPVWHGRKRWDPTCSMRGLLLLTGPPADLSHPWQSYQVFLAPPTPHVHGRCLAPTPNKQHGDLVLAPTATACQLRRNDASCPGECFGICHHASMTHQPATYD